MKMTEIWSTSRKLPLDGMTQVTAGSMASRSRLLVRQLYCDSSPALLKPPEKSPRGSRSYRACDTSTGSTSDFSGGTAALMGETPSTGKYSLRAMACLAALVEDHVR